MTRVTFRKFYDVCADETQRELTPEEQAILEFWKTDEERAAELLKKAKNGGAEGKKALAQLKELIDLLEKKKKTLSNIDQIKASMRDLSQRFASAETHERARQYGRYKWEIEGNRKR